MQTVTQPLLRWLNTDNKIKNYYIMKAKIILSGADFSANNIGQLIDFNPLTSKVLTKQTQYTEDSAEATALNVFLTNLINDGYLGGDNPLIKSLIIPALAASHDELLFDIAHLDGNGYPTNAMSSDEINATYPCYRTYSSNNRIIGLESISSLNLTTGQIKAQKSYEPNVFTVGELLPSFSCCVYNCGNSVALAMLNAGNGTCFDFSRAVCRTKNGSTAVSSSVITSMALGFAGISYDSTTRLFEGVLQGGTFGETTIDTEQTNLNLTVSSEIYLGTTGVADGTVTSRNSLIAFGSKMTTQQLTILKGYIDILMGVLNPS